MNNLTQAQRDAKQAYLNTQREQVLDQYRNADAIKRGAIIKQIDSFLSITRNDTRTFWLKLRENLERLNEQILPPVE